VKYTGQRPTAKDSLPLRSSTSMVALKNFFIKANNYLLNFRIISEVDTIYVKRCCETGENKTSNIASSGKTKVDENWDLNFQYGYPASVVLRFQCASRDVWRYDNPFLRCNTSSGSAYQQFLQWPYHSGIESIFNDSDIPFQPEGYSRPAPNVEYFFKEFLGQNIFVYYQSNQNSFTQKHRHVLPLSKLEKISKYVVQPWENKK
jgi:hypothetical protein